jgi:hypothetical protein|tara:strand:- start:58 stop:1071 length:1014 start_codon:yes stop_codon:yes gene_type:complete
MAQFTDVSGAQAFVAADAKQYFVSPLFLGEDVLAGMDVMTGIKGNTYLDHFSAGSYLTTADAGASFSGDAGTVYTNPQISPNRVEVEIAMSGNNYYNKVKGQVLRSGTNKDNVDGTVLKQIGAEILMQGIKADFNRQLFFGDTTAGLSINGDFSVYKGIFEAVQHSVADAQITVATYSTGANSAITALAAVYASATAELKELPKRFYVSGKVADDYVTDLTAKGVSPAYDDLQNGIPKLSYLGIPIVVRRDWDVVLATKYAHVQEIQLAAGTDAIGSSALGARILLIADNAMVVGTDFNEANVESWYNQDEKEFRFRMGYTCGTVLLDAKMACVYGN